MKVLMLEVTCIVQAVSQKQIGMNLLQKKLRETPDRGWSFTDDNIFNFYTSKKWVGQTQKVYVEKKCGLVGGWVNMKILKLKNMSRCPEFSDLSPPGTSIQ